MAGIPVHKSLTLYVGPVETLTLFCWQHHASAGFGGRRSQIYHVCQRFQPLLLHVLQKPSKTIPHAFHGRKLAYLVFGRRFSLVFGKEQGQRHSLEFHVCVGCYTSQIRLSGGFSPWTLNSLSRKPFNSVMQHSCAARTMASRGMPDVSKAPLTLPIWGLI